MTDVEPAGKGPGGKGRATPKRRDAQKRRRAPAPANRKEASKQRRDRVREQRALQRQALLSGDERHLPPRDAGPAKRLARDIVDSRFTLGQVFFGLILAVLVASFAVNARNYPTVAAAINLLALLSVVVVFVDSVRIGRQARLAVTAAYDAKSAIGITTYATIRAMQPRRFRRPPPKGKRGETIDRRV